MLFDAEISRHMERVKAADMALAKFEKIGLAGTPLYRDVMAALAASYVAATAYRISRVALVIAGSAIGGLFAARLLA